MKAALLDGKALAGQIRREVAGEVAELARQGVSPHLSVVIVGDDPGSRIYVGSKERACKKTGIGSDTLHLPETTSQEDLIEVVRKLNADQSVHGILVQLPLPSGIDTDAVVCAIDPSKDVDGFTPENIGKLLLGSPYTVACTPAGIVELLDRNAVPVEGSDVVIVGRSNIVGKPLAAILMQKTPGRNCTVTLCHSRTKDIARYTRSADIVVAALGKPCFLKADMVRPGCVVVDVGINRVEDPSTPKGYRVVGDADFEALSDIASFITPVPGGIGPLTVAMLLKNTVKVARLARCGP
ncbi:MAG: bifunctional methylenetetrahydrofolate dehydrogenase/methenyltetrahydrofolate cyclohydrolase FolD [Candidatus Eisenbacteria bacterium]